MQENNYLKSIEASFNQALSPIQHLLDDPTITEIHVNGDGDDQVFTSGKGGRKKQEITMPPLFVRAAINALAQFSNRDADKNSDQAFISQKFHTYRVTGILEPTSYKGDSLSIRKHSTSSISLDDLEDYGSIDAEAKEILISLVEGGATFVVGGGTDAGKTTVLNAMLANIPHYERVITIESGIELIIKVPNHLSLLENEQSGITVDKLLHGVLRSSPDRVIVGEIRRKEEAFNFMDVINSGHEGCCCTIHANSAERVLTRLERLLIQAGEPSVESARCGIASLIEYVVHFKKDKKTNKRFLTGILNITGYEHGQYQTEMIHQGLYQQ